MIPAKNIKGNILPTVLIIGTVMLLGVLICIDLYDMKWRISAGNYAELQRNAWIESGMLLYQIDSTLWDKADNELNIKLFEDNEQSTINIARKTWGLYELVSFKTFDNKKRKICLVGYDVDTTSTAALYLCDNKQVLTLAGNCNLIGMAYLPESRVMYSQIGSGFYSGKSLNSSLIQRSSADLPACNMSIISELMTNKIYQQEQLLNRVSLIVPFTENTLFLNANSIYDSTIKGNVVIISNNCIELYNDTFVEDVLLFAPKVKIHDGFRGSIQIISSDSVIIGTDVVLNYPSGIFIPEGKSESYIEIGTRSQLNGYVILCQKGESDEEKLSPHYFQNDSTHVRGLVWVNGISQIHGGITGSLYSCNLNYYTPEGFYQSMLFNAKIYGTNMMAYPLWLKSDKRKKIIKWIG